MIKYQFFIVVVLGWCFGVCFVVVVVFYLNKIDLIYSYLKPPIGIVAQFSQ